MKAKVIIFIIIFFSVYSYSQSAFKSDEFETSEGILRITFIGHGSLMLEWNKKIIQIDPYSKLADYNNFPKADLILITHHHQDHLDSAAIEKIFKEDAQIVMTLLCSEKLKNKYESIPMKNGDQKSISGIKIEAVPAYNIINKRSNGDPYHAKGEGNAYILTLANKRIYIAGDTESIPEMKDLNNIDIAFLPMNLPYTMTPEMVALAARSFKPAILYPYHYGNTDPELLKKLLENEKDIEVRIRDMK